MAFVAIVNYTARIKALSVIRIKIKNRLVKRASRIIYQKKKASYMSANNVR